MDFKVKSKNWVVNYFGICFGGRTFCVITPAPGRTHGEAHATTACYMGDIGHVPSMAMALLSQDLLRFCRVLLWM